MYKKKFKGPNNQAFWLPNDEGEFILVPHINTMVGFSNYLIKICMKDQDLRFITKNKARYINMWAGYFASKEKDLEISDEDLCFRIADEILNYFPVAYHRKATAHPNMPMREMNSRYKSRLRFCIKTSLILSIEN